MLTFKKTGNMGSTLTNELLLAPEKRHTVATEAAIYVLAGAIGVDEYARMDREMRSAMLKDIAEALVEHHPDLLDASTMHLKEGKLPVGTETVAFITETRNAILAAPIESTNPQLSKVKTSAQDERNIALAKRAKLSVLQQHLQDEEIIEKYLDGKLPKRSTLENVNEDQYNELLNKAANPLREGKVDDKSLEDLGLDRDQRITLTENVSVALESVKTHAATAVRSKPSATAQRGML